MYTQHSIVADLILVNLLIVSVIAFQGGGVTSWAFVRMFITFILYRPIPFRTRSISNRPWCFSPEVANIKTHNSYLLSVCLLFCGGVIHREKGSATVCVED